MRPILRCVMGCVMFVFVILLTGSLFAEQGVAT
jgi:hypothetical protein